MKTNVREPDQRSWAYRRAKDGSLESRIFTSKFHIPVDQGWTDSPAKVDDIEVAPKSPKQEQVESAREVANAAIAHAEAANQELADALPDDKGALATQAEALGVKIDKRWGTDRIKEAIALAMVNGEPPAAITNDENL